MDFATQHCVPCEGGVPPMSEEGITKNLAHVPSWVLKEGKLYKRFTFDTFASAMKFSNAIAAVAETEGHHPDLFVTYGAVEVWLWTHAVNGLSVNDFVLAAKIDTIPH